MTELKYAVSSSRGQTPNALMFDKCLDEGSYRYDFTTWTFNSQQPSEGIVVEKGKVTINKFKPNVPIITSNFTGTATDNTPKTTELSALTKNSYAKFTGLTANQSLLTNYTKQNEQNTSWTANLRGLYFAPYRTTTMGEITVAGYPNWMVTYDDGTTSVQLGDELTIRGEGGGYGQIARITDRPSYTKLIPSWSRFPENQDSHWQLGLGIYTSAATDNDGYITLSTPIIFQIENLGIIDPTTVEGYKAAVGSTLVYDKSMTFANVLTAHNLAFKETGTYTESIQSGVHPVITSHYGNEQNTAFVISTRNYSDTYENLRLPYITDLEELIVNNFPFKFWAQLKRDSNHSHIWDSLKQAFRNQDVTDGTFANHLFSKSTGDESQFYISFDVGENTYIDMDGIFDHSTLYSDIYINITSGILKTLHDAFRQTKRLQSLAFNTEVEITDFCGAFEGTALENFPTNVVPRDMWPDNASLSQPTCDIHYAADGSALEWFGNYKNQSALDPEDMCYIMTVDPQCYGAFRANDLSEIKYLLDMKFVAPIAWNIIDDGPDSIYNNAVFYAPNLAVAYIKNLNKGDWSLDGVKRNGVCAGNLTEFDEDCANYMLSNMFDLRLNTSMQSRLESDFNSFNDWTASSGTKRPVVWETWETSTLRKNVYPSGQMKINVALNNCTLSVTNGGNTTTVGTGDQTLNLSSGETIFTFTKTDANQDMSGILTLTEPFMSELTQGLSSANIYLPADWGTREIISQAALAEANARGWNVYIGGQLYTTIQ